MAARLKEPVLWKPNDGPQRRFISCNSYEALYGGSAGSGKSSALLSIPLRWVGIPQFRGLLLRRTFPELQRSLIEKSRLLYPAGGGTYNEQSKVWRFPSGAVIEFGHLEHDHSVHNYQSAEYQFIGFDELTTFTEYQYTYMLSRARSASGLDVRIRSATNPGGEGHDWVFRRWAPWLDRRKEYTGPRSDPGEQMSYRNADDGEEWSEAGTLSRVFIPAKITDNPSLMHNDPQYVERLRGLDPVTRRQLLDGDWLARPAPGAYFQRAWFDFVDVAPASLRKVRRWDLAATSPGERSDPDFTEGMLVSITRDRMFCVENLVSLQANPGDVEKTILNTAKLDGQRVEVIVPQDPGQAGKAQVAAFLRLLAGFNVRGEIESGDKVTRAKPASAQAYGRRIQIVRAPWNERMIQQLEAFPSPGVHDDIVDTLSGAVNALTGRLSASYTATEDEDEGHRRI